MMDYTDVSIGKKRLLTNQTARSLVEAKLRDLGYSVSQPRKKRDPMTIRMHDRPEIRVAVSGLYKPNDWLIRKRQPDASLYYVLVCLPDRFFVMTQQAIADLWCRYQAEHPDAKHTISGFPFGNVGHFEDAWDTLPRH